MTGKRGLCLFLAIGLISGGLLVSCGKRTEAVIGEGDEISTAAAEYPTLEKSSAKKFTYSDLTVDKITYLMTESQVKAVLGEPTEISEKQGTRVFSYNELSVGFEKLDSNNIIDPNNGVYKVTQVASVGDKNVFSRGLKVGDTFDKIITLYYRDSDYRNNYYMSDDKTAVIGKFLYGDFTISELDKVNTKDPIYYALVNFNGYQSEELAECLLVEFTCFDGNYRGDKATINDDFASMTLEIDNQGTIVSIAWNYYAEEKQ